MRTDSTSPVGATVAGLRSRYARARRRIADRAPHWARSRGAGVAVGFGVGAAGLLALAAILVGQEIRPSAATYVLSGQPMSPDDLIRVRRALEAKHVPYRVDTKNRVEVAADRLTEANDAVVKLEVGPRPLDDRQRQALLASPFESPWARDRREEQARLDQLGEIIRRLDPLTVASARVEINRPKATLGQRRGQEATAFVYLETLDDREVNPLTVRSIVGMVSGFAPEVRPDAVSLWDSNGGHYADAHDQGLAASARARARAWELRQQIRDNLGWIKGVEVTVNLVAGGPPEEFTPAPAPMPAPAEAPLPLPPLPDDPPPPPPAEEVRLATPEVGVNQPLDLDPAPEPDPAPVAGKPEPAPVAAEAPRAVVAARGLPPLPVHRPRSAPEVAATERPAAPPPPSKVQVWVKVPRSYYLKALRSREPSLEDLQPLVARTEDLVRTAVEHVVPPGERGDVRVNTIPDEWQVPAPLPTGTSVAQAAYPWWAYSAAGAAGSAALLALASRLFGSRRAALRQATRADRGRFKIDEATDSSAGPGPSERVRELIRLNPEAAASVLLRWTGQGGPAA